jgi:2'-5' RNA ligase
VAETAIVVVVQQARAAVEPARHRFTVDGADGMPAHITLLYPFDDTEVLDSTRIDQLGEAFATFRPFDAELSEVARFERPLDSVLWLAARPASAFVALTESIVSAFPEHHPYGGEFEAIVPHLTVAVSADGDLLARLEAELVAQLPIASRVNEVAIFRHAAAGWRPLASVALTGADG